MATDRCTTMLPLISFIHILIIPLVLSMPDGWTEDLLLVDNGNSNGFSTPQEPALAVDSEGNVHLVWRDGRDIYYKKFNNHGKNLTSDIRVTFNIAESWQPSLVVDFNDFVHLAWSDYRDGNYEVYYKKLDNFGKNLTGDLRVSYSPLYSFKPDIVADGNRNVHIVWGENVVYYKKLDTQGNNLTPVLELTLGNNEIDPSLGVDKSNNLHLSWVRAGGNPPNVYYQKFNDFGVPLSPEIRVTSHIQSGGGGAVVGQPSLSLDKVGNVHLVWTDYESDWNCPWNIQVCGEIHYVKLDNDGLNLTSELRLSYNIDGSFNPGLVVDRCGGVHVAWQQEINASIYSVAQSEIYYIKLNSLGLNLTGETQLTYAPRQSEFPTIGIDKKGIVYVAWQDNRNGDMFHYDWQIYGKRTLQDADKSYQC